MSNDGLIIENMDLSHIHLAVHIYEPTKIGHILEENVTAPLSCMSFIESKEPFLYKSKSTNFKKSLL